MSDSATEATQENEAAAPETAAPEAEHREEHGSAAKEEGFLHEGEAASSGDLWSVHLPFWAPFAPMEGDLPALLHLAKTTSPDESEEAATARIKAQIKHPKVLTWSQPPAGLFLVRGPKYLAQHGTNALGYKQPSGPAGYDCIGINVFRSSSSLDHVAARAQSLKEFLANHEGVNEVPGAAPQFLITCFMFSNWWKTEFTTAVHLFKRRIPIAVPGTENKTADDHAWEHFLSKKTNAERDETVKFMCRIVDAGSALRSSINMLGGERPVIIGKKLTTKYHFGKNYLEISHDVGSSQIASMLCGVVLQNSGVVVLDYAWLLEGQKEQELPERIMGVCRWNWCTAEKCYIQLDSEGFSVEKS